MQTPTPTPPLPRERGSALITVLVFTLGVLAMIGFLLPTTRQAVVAEGEMQRARGLHFVLQTAINDAMNELVEGDKDGDGIGARGTGLPSANPVHNPTSTFFAPGIEVNVGGTSLGFYKTWIDDTNYIANGTFDMVVVAVWPDFIRPRQTLSSRVRFRSEQLSITDKNAISIAGATAIGNDTGELFSTSWASSEFKVEDENDDYAAINVSDARLWSVLVRGGDSADTDHAGNLSSFGLGDSNTDTAGNVTSVVEDTRSDIKGWDKSASQGTQGTGEASVTNAPSKNYVNDPALVTMAKNWRDYATYATTTTDIDGDSAGGATFTTGYAGPVDIGDINNAGVVTDVVRLGAGQNNVLLDGVTVKGKGTLVIPRNLKLVNGAKIDWEGNIVVAHDGTGSSGKFHIEDGEVKLKGNLVIAPDPSDPSKKPAIVEVNTAKLEVEGAIMAITNAGSGDAELKIQKYLFQNEPDVKVKGLFAFLGENTKLSVAGTTSLSNRAKFHVEGGAAFVTPNGRKIKSINLQHRSHNHFKFKETEFLDGVAKALPPGNPPPPFSNRMGYLERAGGALKGNGSLSAHWSGELKALYDAIGAKTNGTATIGTP